MVRRIGFWGVGVPGLVLAVLLAVSAPAAAAGRDATGFYAGTIGKSLAVTVSLRQTGPLVEGYYHYDKNAVDIRLEGAIDPDGTVSLTEFGTFEITGTWSGRISGGVFSGDWTAPSGKRLGFSLDAVSLRARPGEPTGKRVAFGALREEVPVRAVTVPKGLATALVRQLRENGEIEDGSDVAVLAARDPSRLFVGEQIDLNGDDRPELVVQASGETGACTSSNCGFWVFRDQGGRYTELLADIVGGEGYAPLNQWANGFADLSVAQHSSAAETAIMIFRFDGSAYQQVTCILKAYQDETRFRYYDPCP